MSQKCSLFVRHVWSGFDAMRARAHAFARCIPRVREAFQALDSDITHMRPPGRLASPHAATSSSSVSEFAPLLLATYSRDQGVPRQVSWAIWECGAGVCDGAGSSTGLCLDLCNRAAFSQLLVVGRASPRTCAAGGRLWENIIFKLGLAPPTAAAGRPPGRTSSTRRARWPRSASMQRTASPRGGARTASACSSSSSTCWAWWSWSSSRAAPRSTTAPGATLGAEYVSQGQKVGLFSDRHR